MPIQQMLLGVGAAIKAAMELRVWQANSGNGTSATMRVPGARGCFVTFSDGRVGLIGKGEDWADVRSGSGNTSAWMVTSTDTKTIAKTRYLWGSTSQGEPLAIYPYRGSGTDLTLGIQNGYYYAHSPNRNRPHIVVMDSLSNNMAILKQWKWEYPNMSSGCQNIEFFTKDGTDDDYWVTMQDNASGGLSSGNIRIAKMNITSSSISISNCRYFGGDSGSMQIRSSNIDSNENIYVVGQSEEVSSNNRDWMFVLKFDTSSGITWQRNYYIGNGNNYGSGCCEVDSNGNVYSSALFGGQSWTSPSNGYKSAILKHNSSGTLQWAVSWNGMDAFIDGSAMINDKLYILVRYRPDSYNWSVIRPIIAEIDTSDGSIEWQNIVTWSDDRWEVKHNNNHGGSLKAQGNDLAFTWRFFKDRDGSSLIYNYGTAFATGIKSNGDVGDGTIGSLMTYASTNLMTLTDCSSDFTTTTTEFSDGTFNTGTVTDNTSNSEFNTAHTPNQTLTNMNDQ